MRYLEFPSIGLYQHLLWSFCFLPFMTCSSRTRSGAALRCTTCFPPDFRSFKARKTNCSQMASLGSLTSTPAGFHLETKYIVLSYLGLPPPSMPGGACASELPGEGVYYVGWRGPQSCAGSPEYDGLVGWGWRVQPLTKRYF